MGFDSYHPVIHLCWFSAVIAFAAVFRHPVFLAIGFVSACVCCGALGAKKMSSCLLLLAAALLLGGLYACFTHFGVTNLGRTAAGNFFTLESLLYGIAVWSAAATVLLWLACLHAVATADRIVYLLGRASPRLSLGAAILLRAVPRIRERFRRVDAAQCGVGRGVGQGNLFRRAKNRLRIASIVVTWALDGIGQVSASMKSRGCTLTGRTAFSLYRFDNRDRIVTLALSAAVTLTIAGCALDQTKILFDPRLVLNPVTPASFLFYAAYAFLCLLPAILQAAGQKGSRIEKYETVDIGVV